MKKKTEQRAEMLILGVYLLGFLILALTVALNQPLADTPPLFGNPPDEHARYLIPKYICEHGIIPTGLEEEVRIVDYGFSYGLYNVFPYIIQGYVMRVINVFSDTEIALLYAARLVNVVFGLLMAVVVYLLGKKVFLDRRFRWIFCFAVMYLPQSIFVHTYVNTDSCCMLSTAMMVYGLVITYMDGMSRRSCFWMSGGIILCALSYYNAYGYILSSIILFLVYFMKCENMHLEYDWKNCVKWGSFISVIVICGIGWWFFRSYVVLDGDILGLQTREKMAIQYAIEAVNPLTASTYKRLGYSVLEMIQEKNTLEVAFNSFVGAYGSMSVYGPMRLYWAYRIFFGIGLAGGLYYIFVVNGFKGMKSKRLFFHWNMLFCMVMPLVLMLYYSYAVDYQPQGRYLLPSLIPLMYYTVKGIEKLTGIKCKSYVLPKWFINIGVILCLLVILGGASEMVFFRALPVYRETGMVLSR